MLEKYQKEVLKNYHRRKEKNKLSSNLLYPTAANLRRECAHVFHERPDDYIKNILQSFSPIGSLIKNANDVLSIDPDKFRPLLNFINEDVVTASPHNVKLLAWLINFEPTHKIEEASADAKLSIIKRMLFYIKENKLATIISLIVVVLGAGAFIVINDKQCMYWNGAAYEAVGCKFKIDEATIIAFDQQRIDRLKRITRLDTIGEKDLGKVWYVKIKVDSAEFYTDSGEYPLNSKKRLLPMTSYILDKYILKKPVID